MTETSSPDMIKAEIEGKHFVRAAALAESFGIPPSELKKLQKKALWQVAAVFRNAWGARVLCEQYGFSKKEAEEVLRKLAEEQQSRGDAKTLEPTYDHDTGKYLAFDEWLDQFIKRWDKLMPS
jgi:hypothetical protein